MNFGEAPFGLKEVKIVPATGGAVALPAAQRLNFQERILSAELKGDDVIKALVARAEAAEWTLEAGGISLEAYAALTGRTVVTEGVTPAATNTLTGKDDNFPYVKIYGKALGAGADDIHCKLFRAKVTAISGSFQNGAFYVTSCSGMAIPDEDGNVFEFVQNETAADLPAA